MYYIINSKIILSTRSNSNNNDSSKPRKIITRRTRCVNFYNYLELKYYYQEYKNTIDIHASSRSKDADIYNSRIKLLQQLLLDLYFMPKFVNI